MHKKELAKACKWLLLKLGLNDWTVDLIVQDLPPDGGKFDGCCDCSGAVNTFRPLKKAVIWISPARCEKESYSINGCLFHEVLHIMAKDCMIESDEKESAEYCWNVLGDLLAEYYNHDSGSSQG